MTPPGSGPPFCPETVSNVPYVIRFLRARSDPPGLEPGSDERMRDLALPIELRIHVAPFPGLYIFIWGLGVRQLVCLRARAGVEPVLCVYGVYVSERTSLLPAAGPPAPCSPPLSGGGFFIFPVPLQF